MNFIDPSWVKSTFSGANMEKSGGGGGGEGSREVKNKEKEKHGGQKNPEVLSRLYQTDIGLILISGL